jgi:hypothetical protein
VVKATLQLFWEYEKSDKLIEQSAKRGIIPIFLKYGNKDHGWSQEDGKLKEQGLPRMTIEKG